MTEQPNPDVDPLDVAVQIDLVERYRFALSLAVKHGFTDNPDVFANRLRGETADDLEADAREFAEVITDIRDRLAPPRVTAVDPSQAMGNPKPRKDSRAQFADTLFEALS